MAKQRAQRNQHAHRYSGSKTPAAPERASYADYQRSGAEMNLKPPQHQKRPAKQRSRGALRCVVLLACTLCLLVFTVNRELRVIERDKDIRQLQQSIKNETKKTQGLELEIAQSEDIRRIQESARAKGLEYPLAENMRYLVLSPTTTPQQVQQDEPSPWYQSLLEFKLHLFE